MSARIGYLGPEGSFSHGAALQYSSDNLVPFESLADVLAAVTEGDISHGVVPLENALEGTVSAVIDGLVFDHDLMIQQEMIMPIQLALLARPGVALTDITHVHSYTHALGQCRKYLHSLGVTTVPSTSTSQAARDVANNNAPWAAVASPLAGDIFGLSIVADSIEDHPGNVTKFVVLSRGEIAAPTGHDRTTIVCFQDADRPGSLYGILGRFTARDINLTRLESRPTKKGLGDYCFVIEFEGHLADEVVADCLLDLETHLTSVKFLGSYPVSGDDAPRRRAEVTQARENAERWLAHLRASIKKS
jgi:prephenate dehydratase